MDREHEEQMINNFRSEMETKLRQEKEQEDAAKELTTETSIPETSQEWLETSTVRETVVEQEVAGDSRGDIKVEVHATAVHHDQVLEPKVAHAMSHEISHSQAVSKHSPDNIHNPT